MIVGEAVIGIPDADTPGPVEGTYHIEVVRFMGKTHRVPFVKVGDELISCVDIRPVEKEN